MNIRDKLFGRRLKSDEGAVEQIATATGIPVLGLDALVSPAYGPEAALTALIALGSAATAQMLPITTIILVLLGLLFISYRQTIAAYPGGGGAYIVAKQNLGSTAGLLAASALCVDYILNAAVAIAASVGAIVSVIPSLFPYTLMLCLSILAILTFANLRGVRSAGVIFMAPTYAFICCLGITIVLGFFRTPGSHANTPAAVGSGAIGVWLWLRAFASGCTAMTGVEAVSNGVPLFKEPQVKLAQRTLLFIVIVLAVLLEGVAFLAFRFHIFATKPGSAGYETVLSQIISAVAGRGVFYFVAMTAVLMALAFSANTSFADFPRVCRLLAQDEYLPPEFARRGSRLVYSAGIIVLCLVTATLLVIFGGVTDRLIPLFAVGAFLAFSMSQLGMVFHWRRSSERGRKRRMIVNAVGATGTSIALLVIAVTKFSEGAWMTVLIIPLFVFVFSRIHGYNRELAGITAAEGELDVSGLTPPIVVIPLRRLDRIGRKAIRFALTIASDVHGIQVQAEEMDNEDLKRRWKENVVTPLRRIKRSAPELHILQSSYRDFYGRFMTWLELLSKKQSERHIIVLIPELVHRRWYQFLISSRITRLKAMLLLSGNPRIAVMNTPWYPQAAASLKPGSKERRAA